MALALVEKPLLGVKPPDPNHPAIRYLGKNGHGQGTEKLEKLPTVRLMWFEPFLDALMSTYGKDIAIKYNASVTVYRYIEMARQRVSKRYHIRTLSNPVTSTVYVWVSTRSRGM